jgi:hypothetical protein
VRWRAAIDLLLPLLGERDHLDEHVEVTCRFGTVQRAPESTWYAASKLPASTHSCCKSMRIRYSSLKERGAGDMLPRARYGGATVPG